jgi:hypothetical protein
LDKYYRDKRNPKKSFFDRIYLLSPTAHLDWTWVDLDGLKPKDRVTKPSPGTLVKILNDQIKKITGKNPNASKRLTDSELRKLAKGKQNAPKVLVIMDDAIAESTLIHSPEFMKLFIQGRHYGISIMFMTQGYKQIPRSARIQATNIAMFPSRASEIERLYEDIGPKEMSKRDFTEMVQFAVTPTEDEEFPFLYVDVFAPIDKRFRRNLTEQIIIPGGGDEDGGDDYTTKSINRRKRKSRTSSKLIETTPRNRNNINKRRRN